MDDRANTIAGWALAGGIAALGLSIVSGEYFHAERPEKMGYVVEGVEAEAGAEGAAAPAEPIEFYLASSDPAAGEQVFKKCAACHNADKGGANALGPNLWGVLGHPVGNGHGFDFTEALKGKGGTWNWTNLSEWLASPKTFAPGTKMTFAGLSKPEDRANVIAFLNARSDAPLAMPAAPAATEAEAAAASETEGADQQAAEAASGDAQKAEDEPVQTEAQAAVQPKGNIAGEAAPATSGTSAQEK